MKQLIHISFFAFLMLLVASCERDDGIIPQCVDCSLDSIKIDTSVSQVYIMNEGNYGWNNASLSLYNPAAQTNQNNVFQSVNGYVIGDVLQSMEVINEKGYLIVDNSNKIEVVDIATLQVEKSILGINTPRYMKRVSENKAYVTSLFGDVIYVLDLGSNTIIDQIVFEGWSEHVVVVADNAFIESPDSNLVLVIDIPTDKIIKRIPTAKSPNSLVVDKNDKIWVLASGGYQEEIAELIRLDAESYDVETNYFFPDINDSPQSLNIDAYGQQLYFVNQSVYTMGIDEASIPDVAIVDKDGRNIYGFGVAPNTDLYLTDALDYTQQGFVYRYTSVGVLVDSFKVGIIPGNFCFN